MSESLIIPAAAGFYFLRAARCDNKIDVAFDCVPVIAWKLCAHETEPVLVGSSSYDFYCEGDDTISTATQAPDGSVYDLNGLEFANRAAWEVQVTERHTRQVAKAAA